MRIQHHTLQGSQTLDATQLQAGGLHVLRGRGRGATALLPSGWVSACLVLDGQLELHSHDSHWQLPATHLQLWMEGSLRVVSRGSHWIVATAPAPLWAAAQRMQSPHVLFPMELACPRELMRPMVHLARPRWFGTEGSADLAMEALVAGLLHHQQPLQQQLHRCSGRTLVRRQQTLLRLLRVQHLIRCHLDNRLELSRLAASANYSPCHLIRIYREVFDETPSEFAARLRHDRAWRLVCDTDMSVCEIAEALGFVSESAFCRAFKHSFGTTTSEARRQRPRSPLSRRSLLQQAGAA